MGTEVVCMYTSIHTLIHYNPVCVLDCGYTNLLVAVSGMMRADSWGEQRGRKGSLKKEKGEEQRGRRTYSTNLSRSFCNLSYASI